MNTFKTGRVPIKYWLESSDDIEQDCLVQASNLSNLPFVFHHVALMPDTHSGYGMPIGGVLATEGVIVPNAVGVDIGCGMIAVKTSAQEITEKQIKEIIGKAREMIPVGFKHHEKPQEINMGQLFKNATFAGVRPVFQQEMGSIYHQIGTLGGGNHFLEIQRGSDGHIWLMIHSGSRNFGKKVCDYYNKCAQGLNQKWFSVVPKEWNLAFLPLHSEDGQLYLNEMTVATNFALMNRSLMMERLMSIFQDIVKNDSFESPINIHHNYAALENHFGQNVWVHRKGAIRMRQGDIGIIPGSMGTPSYIVRGLGSPESFYSASHGAGRRMSRKKANELITEEMAQEAMAGIVFGRFNGKYDECPQAYKDIDTVMENQRDLVEPLVKLTPLGVMKG
jgi:Uncharacterized conserved protein